MQTKRNGKKWRSWILRRRTPRYSLSAAGRKRLSALLYRRRVRRSAPVLNRKKTQPLKRKVASTAVTHSSAEK